MDSQARENYLQTQVLTATPQKIQLMLIDGSIRFANQVIAHWEQSEDEQSMEAMSRCRRIISEILGGIKSDGTELTKKVSGLYLYIFQTLTEAQLEKSVSKIQGVLRILEIERETWKKVCEDLASTSETAAAQVEAPNSIASFDSSAKTNAAIPNPLSPNLPPNVMPNTHSDMPQTGISFEA